MIQYSSQLYSICIMKKLFLFLVLAAMLTSCDENAKSRLSNLVCTDTLTVYRTIHETNSYTKPDYDSDVYTKGEPVDAGIRYVSGGAVFVGPTSDGYLNISWRGEDEFIPLADVEAITYYGVSQLPLAVFADMLPATYVDAEGHSFTIFILDLQGHSIADQEYEYAQISDSLGNYYMIEFPDSEPTFMQVTDGNLCLCNEDIHLTRDLDSFDMDEKVVVDQKLTCDAFVQTFADPDFGTYAYYLPTEGAFFMWGSLYYQK